MKRELRFAGKRKTPERSVLVTKGGFSGRMTFEEWLRRWRSERSWQVRLGLLHFLLDTWQNRRDYEVGFNFLLKAANHNLFVPMQVSRDEYEFYFKARYKAKQVLAMAFKKCKLRHGYAMCMESWQG